MKSFRDNHFLKNKMESADRFARDSKTHKQLFIDVSLLNTLGEAPVKDESGLGWVVTLKGRTENRPEDIFGEVNCFSTGIRLNPPEGYFLEISALPSLYKQGYYIPSGTLAVGPNNRDELIIPLMKYRECEDLDLPIQAVRIMVKPLVQTFMRTQKNVNKFKENPNPYSNFYQPDMQTGGFRGDMDQYQSYAQNYQKGVKRPVASKHNHMF